jgi:hypothetical protein
MVAFFGSGWRAGLLWWQHGYGLSPDLGSQIGLRGWWWPWNGVGVVTTSGVCGLVVAWAGSGRLREVEVQKLWATVQPGYCWPAVAAPMGVILFLKVPLGSLLRLRLAMGLANRVKA